LLKQPDKQKETSSFLLAPIVNYALSRWVHRLGQALHQAASLLDGWVGIHCTVGGTSHRHSPIGGMNIHGPSAITMMLIIPSTLLAFVLLIMAALGPQEAR